MYIGLLSDTHGVIPPSVSDFFIDVDEIWHAGDIGNYSALESLRNIAPVRAVYGNIDSNDIRSEFNEYEHFAINGIKVLMIHIGGYPNKYSPKAKHLISEFSPDLFISGHSHILKVIYDNKNDLLHINPGAAGNSGFHKIITCVRFRITDGNISDLEILELQRRLT